MKTKMPRLTRKKQLRQRADAYQSRQEHISLYECWLHWENGYRTALKDVRRAVGKSGAPAAVVRLLRPMR